MMKKIILLIYIAILSIPAFSQNIPNGGFEEVFIDTVFSEQSYPINWLSLDLLGANIECFPYLPQGVLSDESMTGNYSIKMETHACEEVGNGLVHRAGGYGTGNGGVWPPFDHSHSYSERPDHLNFYYKFHQEGNDSAYVDFMLFNYDFTPDIPWYERYDTIAFSVGYIFEETSEYIQYSLPVFYLSDSIPDFVSIYFGSGKKNNCTLPTCTPGTTLWVDDVSVSGGTVGINTIAHEASKYNLYPNPAVTFFNIETNENVHILNVQMFDFSGRKIKYWIGNQKVFHIENIPSGIYFVHIQTENGVVVKKMIKG